MLPQNLTHRIGEIMDYNRTQGKGWSQWIAENKEGYPRKKAGDRSPALERCLHNNDYSPSRMNCASALMRTSSLTMTPPASRAAFQFKPQSLRLILPLTENPAL